MQKLFFFIFISGYAEIVFLLGFANHKSSDLYENLPVQTKMAILSRRLILLAIFSYEQFIHYTHINLRPNKQLLSTQQQAYQSFLSYFLL